MPTRVLLIALFLLLPSLLYTQQDIRLSPEPVSYALPGDIRIESAAQIDSMTLVVWGTTRFDHDSTVVNALYAQLLDGSKPLGAPRLLHSTVARPTNFVRVLALDSVFVVLWSDKRDSVPGIYMQRVKLTGENNGVGEKISSGKLLSMAAIDMIRLDLDDGGMRLLWNDTRVDSAGVYSVRIDAAGGIAEATRRVGDGKIVRMLRYDSLPGVSVLLREQHSALIAYSTGTIDSRAVPYSRFRIPLYLNSDTSIAEIEGKSIRHYRSVFDSVAYQGIALPALDSAIMNMTVLTKDTIGNYQAIYAVTKKTGSVEYQAQGWFTLNLYRIFNADDTASAIDTVSTRRDMVGPVGGNLYMDTRYLSGTMRYGCNNSYYVEHILEQARGSYPYVASIWHLSVSYSVNNRGSYTSNTRYFDSCSTTVSLRLKRTRSDTISAAYVMIGSDSSVVSAETAFTTLNNSQIQPAIFSRTGKILLCWCEPTVGPSFKLFEWLPELRDSLRLVSASTPPGLSVGFPNYRNLAAYSYSAGNHLYRLNNAAVISSNQQRRDEYIRLTPAEWNVSYSTRYLIGIPTANGWYYPESFSPAFVDWTNYASIHSATFDWNSNTNRLLVQYGKDGIGGPQRYVGEFGQQEDSAWISVDTRTPFDALVAIDRHEYLGISKGKASHFRESTLLDTLALTPVTDESHYVRLLGSYFLRHYFIDSLHLQLEVFDLQCRLRYSRLLDFTARAIDLLITQRSSDSAIILLWGGNNGVRGTMLNKSLDVIIHDSAISMTHGVTRNPSGVFRNDTLFAAWEDYRNGVADIYGTWRAIPRILSEVKDPQDTTSTGDTTSHPADTTSHPRDTVVSPSSSASTVAITSITPNPAFATATIEFTLPTSRDVAVEMYDALGRAVERQSLGVRPAGKSFWSIDAGRFTDGIYTVILHASGERATARLILFHR